MLVLKNILTIQNYLIYFMYTSVVVVVVVVVVVINAFNIRVLWRKHVSSSFEERDGIGETENN